MEIRDVFIANRLKGKNIRLGISRKVVDAFKDSYFNEFRFGRF